ncbi:hypothetical protein D3C86_1547430 [compost metagenome]
MLGVEAAGPLVLDQGVADAADLVVGGDPQHAVVVEGDLPSRADLMVGDGEVSLADEPLEDVEEVQQAPRTVNGHRGGAAPELPGLHQAGQAEVMVGVQVGEQDVRDVVDPDADADQLALGAFPAVHQEAFAPALDEGGREASLRGRDRSGGPQKKHA